MKTETLREMLKRVSGREPTNEVLDAIENRVREWLEEKRQKYRTINLGGEVDKIFDDLLEELK